MESRIRKTISFKKKIFAKLNKARGQTPFSTFINGFFEKNIAKLAKFKDNQ